MSRVANNPINVPDTVNVSMSDNVVLIKGNKGELDFPLPSSMNTLNALILSKSSKISVNSDVTSRMLGSLRKSS